MYMRGVRAATWPVAKTLEWTQAISRRYLRPQQFDIQAVRQVEFPELAAMADELCRHRDLRQLVDVDVLARAVADSGATPRALTPRRWGYPMGTSLELDVQDWKVAIIG